MSHTNNTHIFHLELTNFLKIYYDFVYFLCICPFRLVYRRDGQKPSPLSIQIKPDSFSKSSFCSANENIENNGGVYYGEARFVVKPWLPQKLICGFLTILGFTWQIRDIRFGMLNDRRWEELNMKNPSIYFKFMLAIAGVLLQLAVVRVFWLKADKVAKILNFMVENSQRTSSHSTKQPKRRRVNMGIFLVIFLFTLISVFNWVLGRGLKTSCYEGPLITKWSIKWWWSAVINASKYNIFMSNEPGNNCTTDERSLKATGGMDTFLGIIGSLGLYYRQVLGLHRNCFILMAIMTLCASIKRFLNHLPNQSRRHKDTEANTNTIRNPYHNKNLHSGYLAIKQLANMINSVYGLNVTLFLVESILYYAVSFDDIFVEQSSNNDSIKVIRLVFYFMSTCSVVFAAADASKQMNHFKEWLSIETNRKLFLPDCLYTITNELDHHVVAIKGSGVFTVTYSLAAKLLGVTLTYFIICVQV